eukprot:TRINITY_DN2105_c0_g1_i1.p1 TRINITY_DN2105_c0_g1~~TRINITY_DN2105_c0_g1_i1.p1  ORF type:complete len:796 (+),score=213.15 TRINITY_DN2105_c0_g1_i1:158-2545(+)
MKTSQAKTAMAPEDSDAQATEAQTKKVEGHLRINRILDIVNAPSTSAKASAKKKQAKPRAKRKGGPSSESTLPGRSHEGGKTAQDEEEVDEDLPNVGRIDDEEDDEHKTEGLLRWRPNLRAGPRSSNDGAAKGGTGDKGTSTVNGRSRDNDGPVEKGIGTGSKRWGNAWQPVGETGGWENEAAETGKDKKGKADEKGWGKGGERGWEKSWKGGGKRSDDEKGWGKGGERGWEKSWKGGGKRSDDEKGWGKGLEQGWDKGWKGGGKRSEDEKGWVKGWEEDWTKEWRGGLDKGSKGGGKAWQHVEKGGGKAWHPAGSGGGKTSQPVSGGGGGKAWQPVVENDREKKAKADDKGSGKGAGQGWEKGWKGGGKRSEDEKGCGEGGEREWEKEWTGGKTSEDENCLGNRGEQGLEKDQKEEGKRSVDESDRRKREEPLSVEDLEGGGTRREDEKDSGTGREQGLVGGEGKASATSEDVSHRPVDADAGKGKTATKSKEAFSEIEAASRWNRDAPVFKPSSPMDDEINRLRAAGPSSLRCPKDDEFDRVRAAGPSSLRCPKDEEIDRLRAAGPSSLRASAEQLAYMPSDMHEANPMVDPMSTGMADPMMAGMHGWAYPTPAAYWPQGAMPQSTMPQKSISEPFPQVIPGRREGEFIGLQSIAEMGDWVVLREKKPKAKPFFLNSWTGEKTWEAPAILEDLGVAETLLKWSEDLPETGLEVSPDVRNPDPWIGGGRRRRDRERDREGMAPPAPPPPLCHPLPAGSLKAESFFTMEAPADRAATKVASLMQNWQACPQYGMR